MDQLNPKLINSSTPYYKHCRYDNAIPLVVMEAQVELRLSENQISVITQDDQVLQQFDWEDRDHALWFAIEHACKMLGRDPNQFSSIALSSQADAIQRTKKILENLVTGVGTLAFEQALSELQGKVEGVDSHHYYQ